MWCSNNGQAKFELVAFSREEKFLTTSIQRALKKCREVVGQGCPTYRKSMTYASVGGAPSPAKRIFSEFSFKTLDKEVRLIYVRAV